MWVSPYGFLEVLTCVASLIAVEEDSIIKKAVKKAVETNLNELLNIENYKVIGIKTLSRTMELLYSINQFKDINDLDKGICALVFLLLCLDNPSDVAVYSCYAEYIMRNEIAVNKGLDERDEKKSEIIDFIQEGSISLVEELEYIKNHSDSFKTRLKQDDLMTSMFLYKRFNVYSHIDMIETLIRNNKDDILACILYKYPVDTWEKLPIENRAWIVYKTTIGDQIINDAGSCMEWFPYAKENEKTELSECDTEEIVERVMKEYKCEKSKAVSDKTPFEFSEENDKKQKEAINQLQRESNLLRTQLKEIRMENHKLNTELNQIQSEKDSEKLSQEERQELNRLREFVFRLKSEEDSMDDKSIDEKVIRNAGTIVLIGGHTTLYRKLIDKYENIRCIDGRKRVSFDMIHDASYVFFLFDFMSHGSYYQGCRECSKVNVPYGYIQGTNLEKAEKQMIEAIKEFDKA